MTTALNDPGEPRTDRSYWSRLTETPMRDLVRGRATGRLDTDRLIEEAALPASVAEMVRRVVRRTRLWRLEKVDVARELIAHFRDALAAPATATAQQLLADFGDERQAAKLIRRAKRRQRPLLWHAWRRTAQAVGGLLLVLILTYAWLAFHYWTGAPKVTHDYLADVNAAARAVPKEQAAWPHYREALLALPRDDAWKKAHNLLARPGDWDWAPAAQAVRDHQPAIAQLRDAAAMPGMGFQIAFGLADPADAALMPESAAAPPNPGAPWQGSLYGVLLPQVSHVRRAGSWLTADARVATLEHDGARALADIRAILGAARHSRENAFLISDLVHLAIADLALQTSLEALADAPDMWTDDQLRDLAHTLAAVTDETLRPRLEAERAGFADFVQRVYTDDGAGNGHISRDWLAALNAISSPAEGSIPVPERVLADALGPAGILVLADRRDLLREYDRIIGVVQTTANTPMWERHKAPRDPMLDGDSDLFTRARYNFLELLLPSYTQVIRHPDYMAMKRDAALTAIALELFHRANGRYPPSLTELVPAYMPHVPLDRYDGGPIKRAITDEGKPLLYSIGNDREDNGGRLHRTKDGTPDNENPMRWMPPGGRPADPRGPGALIPARGSDWILFPPVRVPTTPPDADAQR